MILVDGEPVTEHYLLGGRPLCLSAVLATDFMGRLTAAANLIISRCSQNGKRGTLLSRFSGF